jgi:hypothetical protein
MLGRLLFAVGFILLSLASTAQAVTTISLPTLTNTPVGSMVTVNVDMNASPSIGGILLQIQYDPAVLALQSDSDIVKGPRAGTQNLVVNRFPNLISTNPATGAGVRMVLFGTTSIGGNGTLLDLKFRVAGVGSTPLIITQCQHDDPPVDCLIVNGSFSTNVCTPTTETCNGVDDDCNNQIDDGFDVGTTCSAGVGACQSAGVKVCSANGTGTVCNATPGEPSPETCNGVDDDCNNQIDNGFDVGAGCSVGIGACQHNGVKACTGDGTDTACNAVAGEPGVEGPFGNATCSDGVDNDCDTTIDAADSNCLPPLLNSLIPGGGGAATDCMMEWRITGLSPALGRNGLPLPKQSCMDGASCDGDGLENGSCTFHVSACLNVPDSRLQDRQGNLLCTMSDVAFIASKNLPDDLQTRLASLGGQVGGRCTNRGDKKGNFCQQNSDCDTTVGSGDGKCKGEFVVFTNPLTAQACTATAAPVVVPLKVTRTGQLKKASESVSATAFSAPQGAREQREKDADSLQMICLPPEEQSRADAGLESD